MNKGKLITGIIIILATAGYMVYLAGGDAFVYYYSVDELFENNLLNEVKQTDKSVRIAGTVKNIKSHIQNNTPRIEFELSGNKHKILVICEKRVPDNFEENRPVVVQGKEFIEGKFAAEKLLTRCESKYKSRPENGGQVEHPANQQN